MNGGSARGTYNWLVSSSVIASISCAKLGAGLNQPKPNTSGDDEGEGGVNPVEYTEGEDEDVQNEYC